MPKELCWKQLHPGTIYQDLNCEMLGFEPTPKGGHTKPAREKPVESPLVLSRNYGVTISPCVLLRRCMSWHMKITTTSCIPEHETHQTDTMLTALYSTTGPTPSMLRPPPTSQRHMCISVVNPWKISTQVPGMWDIMVGHKHVIISNLWWPPVGIGAFARTLTSALQSLLPHCEPHTAQCTACCLIYNGWVHYALAGRGSQVVAEGEVSIRACVWGGG